MKKILVPILILMFFVISCNNSKKAENDADILPDEDVISDEDAVDADETDEDDEDAIADDDEIEDIDLCEPDPCVGIENSTEECIADADKYSCGCIEGYFWDGKKCVNPCNGIDCGQFEHTIGECKSSDAFAYKCDCEEGFWWWKDKGCIAQKHTAANVCTGQTKCYDDEKEIECPAKGEKFYGQDAQYAKLGYCIPQSFSIDDSVENETVVVDNNLGLMWQRKIPPTEERYIEDVKQYCEDLVYGGYDDWTLPTVEEFMTIADYGKYDPAVNTEYFPDSGDFWTSSYDAYSYGGADTHGYYTVYYYTAIFDFNEPSTFFATTYYFDNYNIGSQTYYAHEFNIRCLRRNSVSAAPHYFTSKTFGNDMMWNNYNDLIFMKTGTKLSWSEALEYCSELDYAGISDWRLPNVKELALNSKSGVHSSTTALYDLNYDYSSKREDVHVLYVHSKESSLTETFCVANDPCESKKFWNGEKCAKNPCLDDPCKSDSNSDGICNVLDEESYSCSCKQSYKWSQQKLQCVHTCLGNPCSTYSNSDKQCYDDDVEGFYCGCIEPYFWNSNSRRCTQNCDLNPCEDKENSDGVCYDDENLGHTCGCIEGYTWHYSDCVEDRCNPNPCENAANSDGTCILTDTSYYCVCVEGYYWDFEKGECQ